MKCFFVYILYVGPGMSWRRVQGPPHLSPEGSWDGLHPPQAKEKVVGGWLDGCMDGWMDRCVCVFGGAALTILLQALI